MAAFDRHDSLPTMRADRGRLAAVWVAVMERPVVGIATVLASWWPALRAMRIDPVELLRTE